MQHRRHQGDADNACSAWSLPLGQPRKPRMHRLDVRVRGGCAEARRVHRKGVYITNDSKHKGPVG
jgi:hypothetical protein